MTALLRRTLGIIVFSGPMHLSLIRAGRNLPGIFATSMNIRRFDEAVCDIFRTATPKEGRKAKPK